MYKAKRLPVQTGPAAWNALLPARVPHAPVDGDRTADFAIVGGGFAGLSAAYRLSLLDPRARIVLLEAGAIGEAASGRNSGFMIDLPHDLTSEDYAGRGAAPDRAVIDLNRAAIAFAGDAVARFAIDANHFDPAGRISGATTDAGHAASRSYAAHLDGLGEGYERLDGRQMREVTGSDYYVSGLHTPGTVMLQPAGYVRGLADGLARIVGIHEHCPVTRLERQGQAWRVETPGGAVSAGQVILANNGHLESFGFARNRLMHVFLFASMTRELDAATCAKLGGGARWGVTPSDPMGTTVRRIDTGQGGDRILVRTCAEFRPGMVASARKLASATRVLRDKFDARFPGLAHVAMEHTWAGHLCLSRNSVSVTGRLDDGLFAACCQNGLGATRGTLTGIAAAERASGQDSAISDFFDAEAAPSRLPPPPLSTWGANACLAWKERRARFE